MPTHDDKAIQCAKILWNYHNVASSLEAADFVLALGSSDTGVAPEAASLVLDGLAPLLIISGGLGKVTTADGGDTEASRFAKVAAEVGIAADRLLLEPTATNTGENFTKTKALVISHGLRANAGIFVTKPYMKRRALATAFAQWPEVNWIPHAPSILFEDYPDETISREQMIQLMVGDLQRIELYPDMGFQVKQEIPSEVWDAYGTLVGLGFDKYVIRGSSHKS